MRGRVRKYSLWWYYALSVVIILVTLLAVTWYVENTLALENAENTFLYIVDLEPPVVVPVSPVGEPYDNDGDGVANEDPRDCINNDGDYWWYGGQWVERFDEDWIDYEPDTLLFGERPTIQGAMNDNPQCGSGASGVNLETFHLFIDGIDFTIANTANADLNFTVLQPGNDDAFFLFGGTDNEILDPFYEPGEHRITVIVGDSVCGNIAPYPFSWTYYITVPGPAITFDTWHDCGYWFDPEEVDTFGFSVETTADVALAINGIDYSVYILPSNELISGPTTINPDPESDSVHVSFVVSYPFEEGDEGIRVHVTARNELDFESESDQTYAMDDMGPGIAIVSPEDGEQFGSNTSVVVEATFSDSGQSGVNTAVIILDVWDPLGNRIEDTQNPQEPYSDHVKWVLTPGDMERAGIYTIDLTVGDCVENLSTESWTFLIESTGPSIEFHTSSDSCGDWFDPEGDNVFTFTVYSTGDSIATNGIEYRVVALPDSEVIIGTTVINPDSGAQHNEEYHVAYPFGEGDEGIWVEVTARSVLSGEDFGVTVSNHTYAIDDLAPTILAVTPDSAEVFNRDQAIVIEATYFDDGGVILSANPGGEGSSMGLSPTRASRVARGSGLESLGLGLDRPGQRGISGILPDDGGMAHLDDVGSGIDTDTLKLTIIRPDGRTIVLNDEDAPSDPNFDVYDDHTKYILVPDSITVAGWYTINLTVGDCVGNLSSITWPFFVTPAAPFVRFLTYDEGCNHDGFWNPDLPLTVRATITEDQTVNVTPEGICLNIYRLYNTEEGVVEELLVPCVTYIFDVDEGFPSDTTGETFILEAKPSLNPDPADIAVRFELIVADVYGTTATVSKTYQIDRMAPWIEILSPAEVVPEGAVTIHAVFSDEPPPAIATAPGGDRGRFASPSSMLSGTPQQNGRITRATRTRSTATGGFGDWSTVMTGGLDDFEGNSGVDSTSVELLLRDPYGYTDTLTDADWDVTGVTWTTDSLERGDYVITIKVSDYVCNEGVALWNFRVANGDCPTIAFVGPYYVSSMPDTFEMTVEDPTGVDASSLRLIVEKLQRIHTDSTDIEHYVVITDNASIEWNSETSDSGQVRYVANFFLENSPTVKDVGVRLTLCASDLDENLCCVSKNYTVDQDRPFIDIDGVVPSPDNPLVIDSRPTFIVSFHEEGGGTGIDTDTGAVTITLATLGGVIEEGVTEVYVSPTGATGNVSFQPADGLEPGKYLLRVRVADVGGNVAMAEWVYRVGKDIPVLTGKKSYVWPNPFVPGEGGAHFELGVTGEGTAFVMVKVYDIAGQYVATVYEGQYEPGRAIIWYGTNDKGQEVANGVYLAHVVIETGGQVSDEIVKVAFKKVK